jgi:hypothetical protein
MTGLGLLRTHSQVGVGSAGRHLAEGNRPTDGKRKAPPPAGRKWLVG